MPFKADYVMEFLRLEGQTEEACQSACVGCEGLAEPRPGDTTPLFRCQECFRGDNLCLGCCLDRHHAQPLHVVEVRTELSAEPYFTDIIIEMERPFLREDIAYDNGDEGSAWPWLREVQ